MHNNTKLYVREVILGWTNLHTIIINRLDVQVARALLFLTLKTS